MLPDEQRTLAPPGQLLGVPAGEGAPRGRAQGRLHAENAGSKKRMVMQLAEGPRRLWEVCGKHSGQITRAACGQCAPITTRRWTLFLEGLPPTLRLIRT